MSSARIPAGIRTGFRTDSERNTGAREHAYEHARLNHFKALHSTSIQSTSRHFACGWVPSPIVTQVTRAMINDWAW